MTPDTDEQPSIFSNPSAPLSSSRGLSRFSVNPLLQKTTPGTSTRTITTTTEDESKRLLPDSQPLLQHTAVAADTPHPPTFRRSSATFRNSGHDIPYVSERELRPTPITPSLQTSDEDAVEGGSSYAAGTGAAAVVGDSAISSAATPLTTNSTDDQRSYAAVCFNLRVHCQLGDEYKMVKQIKELLAGVSRRCRVQAYKERKSHGDEDLFDGVVQVVPMYTLLQVSLERICNHPRLLAVTGKLAFWIAMFLTSLALFAVITVLIAGKASLESLQQQPLSSTSNINSILAVVMLILTTSTVTLQLMYFAALSRQLLLLLLKTFDFWMLQFYVLLTIASNFWYLVVEGSPVALRVCVALVTTITLEALLCLDAFPPLSRQWKGLVYFVIALYYGYHYLYWLLMARDNNGNAATLAIRVGPLSIHVATVAQYAAAALCAFNARLCVRASWKRLDLQLIDFPVNMVPHIDEVEQRKFEVEHSQRIFASSHTDAPAAGAAGVNISGASATARDGDTVDDYRRHASSMRFSSPRGRWASSPSSPLSLWLNIQGSLPCAPGAVDSVCVKLHDMAKQQVLGAKVSVAVVDNSTAFDCDRRTFEPNCLMRSFSPKPLIPLPLVFRGLSTTYWTALIVVAVGGAAVILFVVNLAFPSNNIALSAVMSFLMSLVVIQLLCGTSVELTLHAATTLDFWYILGSFAALTYSGFLVYRERYGVSMAALHSSLVVSTAFWVATIDAIVLTTFTGSIKGVVALSLALYCVVDVVLILPPLFAQHPELFNRATNDTIALVSPASLAIISNIGCVMIFLRIAGRTLWMGSRVVFLQYGALEEILSPDDIAATLGSGGGARGVDDTLDGAESKRCAAQVGRECRGDVNDGKAARTNTSDDGNGHLASGASPSLSMPPQRAAARDASPTFSKASFFTGASPTRRPITGRQKDRVSSKVTKADWRAAMVSSNARFVKPPTAASQARLDTTNPSQGTEEDGEESEPSSARFT